MSSMFHSFLDSTATCSTCSSATFEKLVFWTIGYGGWMGVGILPILWSLPMSRVIKGMLMILSPVLCALVMTAAFSGFYMFGLFMYHMSAIMISPLFLKSCVGIVAISVGTIVFSLVNAKRIEIHMNGIHLNGSVKDTASDASDAASDASDAASDASDAASDASDAASDASDAYDASDASDAEDTDDSHRSDAESSEDTDNSHTSDADDVTKDDAWREKADCEALRNASPLTE